MKKPQPCFHLEPTAGAFLCVESLQRRFLSRLLIFDRTCAVNRFREMCHILTGSLFPGVQFYLAILKRFLGGTFSDLLGNSTCQRPYNFLQPQIVIANAVTASVPRAPVSHHIIVYGIREDPASWSIFPRWIRSQRQWRDSNHRRKDS